MTDLRVVLDLSVIARIQRSAVDAYPDEACGLLLGRAMAGGTVYVDRIVPIPNAAAVAERGHRFSIEPRVLLAFDRAAEASGGAIVGFFHSHPDAAARPSETDAALAWAGYVYLIASTTGQPGRPPLIAGIAAWTFDESARTFREMSLEVRPAAADEIDYVI